MYSLINNIHTKYNINTPLQNINNNKKFTYTITYKIKFIYIYLCILVLNRNNYILKLGSKV